MVKVITDAEHVTFIESSHGDDGHLVETITIEPAQDNSHGDPVTPSGISSGGGE
jgi:hypothetical protein